MRSCEQVPSTSARMHTLVCSSLQAPLTTGYCLSCCCSGDHAAWDSRQGHCLFERAAVASLLVAAGSRRVLPLHSVDAAGGWTGSATTKPPVHRPTDTG